MKHKLFTFILALTASVGTLFAESGTCGENVTWNLTDGTLTISGTGNMTNYSSYSSVPWYSSRSDIKIVNIGDGVTSITGAAFYGCSSLISVTIPNSVTSIGYEAFYHCTGLTSVTIGNSVTGIGEWAFSGCSSLTSVTIPNSVTSIGNGAFSDCSSLTSIEIPNSVTGIGYGAFRNVCNIVYNGTATGSPWGARSINGYVDGYLFYSDNTKTTLLACSTAAQGEIVIPNSVTSIGQYAFSNCSGLTSVTIPNSVTNIGSAAFYDCCSLTSVTIPNSVSSIGERAFYSCKSLPVIDNLRYADRYLVEAVDKTLPTYAILNGTKWIGSSAFIGCSGLTSVTIPNSVTSIGEQAFRWCGSLTSVTIGNSVTSIEGRAFFGCRSLTSIIIPNSVTNIGRAAFYDCTGLTSVMIPNSVTSIGENAFYNCRRLNSIACEATTPPCCGTDAFYSVYKGIPLYVPAKSIDAYKTTYPWSAFVKITRVTTSDQ